MYTSGAFTKLQNANINFVMSVRPFAYNISALSKEILQIHTHNI